jgi:hypothetical protein
MALPARVPQALHWAYYWLLAAPVVEMPDALTKTDSFAESTAPVIAGFAV